MLLQFYNCFGVASHLYAVASEVSSRASVIKNLEIIGFYVEGGDSRVMADLLCQKLVASELVNVFKSLSQERIERFADSMLIDRISGDDKGGNVEHSHILIVALISFFE